MPHAMPRILHPACRILPPALQAGLATKADALLIDAVQSDGGVQGLGWRAEGLQVDEDGDEADEFIELDSAGFGK